MSTTQPVESETAATRPSGYRVIGTRPIRHDGVDKVTGRAQYGADIRLSGMVYGAMLRSPHPHARIRAIDTSAAQAMPGVLGVVTHADLPDIEARIGSLGEGMFNARDLARNVLARDKVLYVGHAVAAVAAETRQQAEEAVRQIRVEYEVLPPVFDVLEAMHDDAPILHEDLRTDAMGETTGERPTNVARKIVFEKGSLDEGFRQAALIVEREFRTSTVHQGYIEPHNATALWNADGHLTVWTSTQGSFTVRQQLSHLLDLPVSKITVVPMEIGGGFGGKICVYLDPVVALLSRKCGQPVKMVMDRAEVFAATGPAPATFIRVKMGVDEKGRITAAEAWLAYEAGAFPGSPIGPGCMCVFACYDVPNGRVEGYDVCVNKPQTRAYRAPGSPQAAFATESVIDEICQRMNLDPLEFRLLNAARKGTRRVDGVVFDRIGMAETVQAIQQSEHAQSELARSPARSTPPFAADTDAGVRVLRGRGVASGFWFNAGLKSSVTAAVNDDGTVSLIEGSTDIGGTRTSVAMQLAETLGIPAEDVHPVVVDTDRVGYTDVTGGSRVTFATGWAAHRAGLEIQRQLRERAARLWNVDVESVRYEDGTLVGPEGQSLTFRELAARLPKLGPPVVGCGSAHPDSPGGAFGTHMVDVEVDPETGKVQIVRYTAAQDVGTAVHPSYVEGQIQGGVAQGIGWALHEEYVYDEQGRLLNPGFLDYRMPTSYDLPHIETLLVEVPHPGHPFGVRGVGEVPIVPPLPAVANAIARAVGVRIRELPISPPRLLQAILAARENGRGDQRSD